jgi:hypothetical protein
MSVYRVFWLFFCSLLGVLGIVVAFTWSFSTIIMLFSLAALTGGVVAMVSLDPEDPTRPPRDRRRIVATSSVLGGVGTLALVGLGTLLGAPMTVLLLAMTTGGSPYGIRRCMRWLGHHGHLPSPSPKPTQPDPGERSSASAPDPVPSREPDQAAKPHVAPTSLSDDALCLAWRSSFSALQQADSPAQRLRIVEQRRAYLDELERRNAHGMAAWLASGARAAGDPSRFVLGDSAAGRSAIDWDSLIHGTDK